MLEDVIIGDLSLLFLNDSLNLRSNHSLLGRRIIDRLNFLVVMLLNIYVHLVISFDVDLAHPSVKVHLLKVGDQLLIISLELFYHLKIFLVLTYLLLHIHLQSL